MYYLFNVTYLLNSRFFYVWNMPSSYWNGKSDSFYSSSDQGFFSRYSSAFLSSNGILR